MIPLQYIKWLVNQTCIQRYDVYLKEWQVSLIWSFTVSIFSIGGLLGSLLAAPCLSTVGRLVCANESFSCHDYTWRSCRSPFAHPVQEKMSVVQQFGGDSWRCADALQPKSHVL